MGLRDAHYVCWWIDDEEEVAGWDRGVEMCQWCGPKAMGGTLLLGMPMNVERSVVVFIVMRRRGTSWTVSGSYLEVTWGEANSGRDYINRSRLAGNDPRMLVLAMRTYLFGYFQPYEAPSTAHP